MARDYPRIGSTRDMRKKWTIQRNGKTHSVNNRPRCAACSEEASYRVDIQVNWFRGDDEARTACPAHKNDAAALLGEAKESA